MAKSHPIRDRSHFKDLTGQCFGELTVLSYAGPIPGHQLWNCSCSCGQSSIVRSNNLLTGHTTSCGCVQAARFIPGANTRHKHSHSPEWNTWQRMKQRCHNPNNPGYPDYGARGITVCQRWLESFESFLADMGLRPSAKYSLGRVDNDGPYAPENCRWETMEQQMGNRRSTRRLTYQGRTMTLAQWAREIRVPLSTLHLRLKRGWTTQKALTTPCQKPRIRYEPFTFIA